MPMSTVSNSSDTGSRGIPPLCTSCNSPSTLPNERLYRLQKGQSRVTCEEEPLLSVQKSPHSCLQCAWHVLCGAGLDNALGGGNSSKQQRSRARPKGIQGI